MPVGLFVAAAAVTAVSVVATVPCQWAVVQMRDGGLCAVSLWRSAALPWLLAVAGMVVVVAAAAAAVRAGAGSWRRTRDVIRQLEAASSGPSPALMSAASSAGVERVREVDVPQPVALCYGLRKPVVLVLASLVRRLGREELLAVLLHERAHVARRDPLRLAVLRFAAAFGPGIPAVRALVAHSVLVSEWSADAAAIRVLGVRPVASAMRAVLTHPAPVDVSRVNAPGFCLTAERVEMLGRPDPPRLKMGARPAAVSALVVFVAGHVLVMVMRALTFSAGVVDVLVDWHGDTGARLDRCALPAFRPLA